MAALELAVKLERIPPLAGRLPTTPRQTATPAQSMSKERMGEAAAQAKVVEGVLEGGGGCLEGGGRCLEGAGRCPGRWWRVPGGWLNQDMEAGR